MKSKKEIQSRMLKDIGINAIKELKMPEGGVLVLQIGEDADIGEIQGMMTGLHEFLEENQYSCIILQAPVAMSLESIVIPENHIVNVVVPNDIKPEFKELIMNGVISMVNSFGAKGVVLTESQAGKILNMETKLVIGELQNMLVNSNYELDEQAVSMEALLDIIRIVDEKSRVLANSLDKLKGNLLNQDIGEKNKKLLSSTMIALGELIGITELLSGLSLGFEHVDGFEDLEDAEEEEELRASKKRLKLVTDNTKKLQ